MADKIFKTRVQNKNDTSENWKLATNFKPLKGEMILYTDTKQMKVGDGKTLVNDLPFYPSGDATTAGDNVFTGENTFYKTVTVKGSDQKLILKSGGNTAGIDSQVIVENTGDITFSPAYSSNSFIVHLPQSNGDLITSNDIANYARTDIGNTFNGINTFDGQLNTSGLHVLNSKGGMTLLSSSSSIESGSEIILSLPSIAGTLALKEDISANPADEATTALSKIKINNVIYSIPTIGDPIVLNEGDYKTTISSGSIKFEDTDYNKSFSINYGGTITHLAINGVESRIQAPNIAGNFTWGVLPLTKPTEDSIAVYTNGLIPSWKKMSEIGGGDVTAAGDNMFTGTNTFKKTLTVGDNTTNPYQLKINNDSGSLVWEGMSNTFPTIELYPETSNVGSKTFRYRLPCKKEAEGDPVNLVAENENNTFSGFNTFNVGTTFKSGIECFGNDGISFAQNDVYSLNLGPDFSRINDDYNLELPVANGVLALTSDIDDKISSLFTYANNTLTINI